MSIMREALEKAGFKMSPELVLKEMTDRWRDKVLKEKYDEAMELARKIKDYAVLKRLKLPDEILEQKCKVSKNRGIKKVEVE